MGMRNWLYLAALTLGSVSAMAAADLYAIGPAAKKKAPTLKLNDKALQGPVYFAPVPGDTLSPCERPALPAAGVLYLRRKLDAKTYGWYCGEVSDQAFASLYTFSLKDKGLSVQEMLGSKMFGTFGAKAFQDEQDIYFDKDNLYASRVPTLYFKMGGVWQTLESSGLAPGVLRIESEPVADVISGGRLVGQTPMRKGPAQPGVWTFVLQSKGYLPVSVLTLVNSKEATVEQLRLSPIDTAFHAPASPVDSAAIEGAQNLTQLETYYDALDSAIRVGLRADSARVAAFASLYAPPRPAPASLPETSAVYRSYLGLYEQTRRQALDLWLGVERSPLRALQRQVRERMRPMEQWVVRGQAPVRSAAFSAFDSTRRDGMLEMSLRSTDGRLQVLWKGAWKSDTLSGDSAVARLLDTLSPYKVLLTLENKPVWIAKDSGMGYSRRFYRFLQAEMVTLTDTLPLQGQFLLSDSIAREPEVIAWLAGRAKPPIVEPKTAPVIVSAPKVVLDTAALYQAYLAELFRGKVVEIPGGSFRYKNKLVTMSPFAIQATEVPQLHYERILQKNPSSFKAMLKPVQNLDWYKAKAFCEEIGGNLPTEAQWEYAARAGSNLGQLWKVVPSEPKEHAVYGEISAKLGKKHAAYGPQEVGKRKPNAFGLYDMQGNMAEWTRDNSSWFSFSVESKDPTGAYFGHFKMFKGGSWKDELEDLNMLSSDDEDPRYWGASIGVRCVFPSQQKVDTAKVREYFAKRQVVIPPFVVGGTPAVVEPQQAKPQTSKPEPAVQAPAKAVAPAAPAVKPASAQAATPPAPAAPPAVPAQPAAVAQPAPSAPALAPAAAPSVPLIKPSEDSLPAQAP